MEIGPLEIYFYPSETSAASWEVKYCWSVDGRACCHDQSAYRIQLASCLDRLGEGMADLWDSGWVESRNGYFVPGKELPAKIRCFGRVGIQRKGKDQPDWSTPVSLATPLPPGDSWGASWISHDIKAIPANPHKAFVIDMRKAIDLERIEFAPFVPDFMKIEASMHADFRELVRLADFSTTPCRIRGIKWMGKFETRGVRARYLRISSVGYLRDILNGIPLEILVTATGSKGASVFVMPADLIQNGEIALPEMHGEVDANVLFRKVISVREGLHSALCYYTGLGVCGLFLDGKSVMDDCLWPPFTNVTKRVYYRHLDLTEKLQPGEHILGASLGNGFRNLPTPDIFGHQRCEWQGPPCFLFELHLAYDDGRTVVISSDGSWETHFGRHVFNCPRGGETLDASVDEDGLLASGENEGWTPAIPVRGVSGALYPDSSLPIKMQHEFPPQKIAELSDGTVVADFGRNLTGWVELEAEGSRGHRIVLRSNDLTLADGTVDIGNCSQFTYGRFQTDVYHCSGEGPDRFAPRFSYRGFRHVEIRNYPGVLDTGKLKAVHVANELKGAGALRFSDPHMQALHELCQNTFVGLLHSIPDDSTREKMGWLGESGLLAEGLCLNFQLHRFYRKWLFDILDTQVEDGLVACMAPECGIWHRVTPGAPPPSHNDPWWCGTLIIVAWDLFQFYGDIGLLRTALPAAHRLMKYIEQHSEDLIVSWNLGDWLELDSKNFPQRSPVPMTSTLGFYHLATLMARMATAAGEKAMGQHYAALKVRIGRAFQEKFFAQILDPALNSQTVWGLVLGLGLAKDNVENEIVKLLDENIRLEYGGHLSTGSIGTAFVLQALAARGLDETLYRVLRSREYPGWGYMLEMGAAALWENWNGLESQCHATYGGLDACLFRQFGALLPSWSEDLGRHLAFGLARPLAAGDVEITQEQTFYSHNAKWAASETGLNGYLAVESDAPVFFDLTTLGGRWKEARINGKALDLREVLAGGKRKIQLPGSSEVEISLRS